MEKFVLISEHGNPLNTVAQDDINENDQNFKTPSSTLMEKKRSRGHSHSFRDASQMNMRGIFLHVLADALGSVVVVISALVSIIIIIISMLKLENFLFKN